MIQRTVLLALLLCTLTMPIVLRAQTGANGEGIYCGADAAAEALYRVAPEERAHAQAIDRLLYQILRDGSGKGEKGRSISGDGTLYMVPVVVHIIHDGGPENLSDDEIRTAIARLNEAFANVGEYDSTSGVPVEIRFCLARQDERGKATTGITRVRSPLTELMLEEGDVALKDLDRWNPRKYLNIWVTRSIASHAMGTAISGYAYGPTAFGSAKDGIVLESTLLEEGADPLKILVHELGHYFGLYHTFQAGCTNDDCLIDGDQVCDTPPDETVTNLPCNIVTNSCSNDPDDPSPRNPFRARALGGLGDQDDLPDNYMDYGLQECRSAFTNGQRERMIAVLTTLRASLLSSNGCDDPCTSDLRPTFTPGDRTVDAGSTIDFVNGTIGAARFEWELNGKLVGTARDFSYGFMTQGVYTVTLTAYSADSTCARSYSVTITVLCPMSLSFTPRQSAVQPGDVVDFILTSSGATSFRWFVDGVQAGVTPNLTYRFTTAGLFQVYVVGYNGICYDTSEARLIRVGSCRAGHEDELWYFGSGVGLDFRNGIPFARGDGAIDAHEGSASICDADGRLLFYSDGVQVIGRDHRMMENGDGILGSQWAAQGCLIARMPGSDSLYYLFTAGNWNERGQGLRYSVIDMSRNGGLGAVITKNVLLDSTISERVAGVYHSNCLDVWIVTHQEGNTRFAAYRLSSDGVDSVPVVSDIGSPAVGVNRFGCLKFSADGSQLLSVFGGDTTYETLELYSFDMGTGRVANHRPLSLKGDYWAAYSGEFSPNGRFVYFTTLNGTFVYQYDLKAGDVRDIRLSKTNVAQGKERRIGLQVGPDGRIYVTRNNSSYLDLINLPNNPGNACDYKTRAVWLAGRSASLSLPGYIAGYTVRTVGITPHGTPCMRGSMSFEAQGGWCARGSYLWSVQGPATIRAIDGIEIALDFTDSGQVTLFLDNRGACYSLYDTLTIAVPYIPRILLPRDTIVCGTSCSIDAGSGFASYSWRDGSTGRVFNARSSGTYWVEATAANGCVERDTINVVMYAPGAMLDLGGDTTICGGEVVTLDAGPGFLGYRWQDGSETRRFSAYQPGLYWVTAVSACGDTLIDSVTIGPRVQSLADLGPDLYLCSQTSVQLEAGPPGLVYRWSTGDTTRTLQVRDSGSYAVYVSNGWCEGRDTVHVEFLPEERYEISMPRLAAVPQPLDTEVTLPLRLRRVAGGALPRGLPYSGTIRFNASLLMPVGETPLGTIVSGMREIPFSGVVERSDTVGFFTFRTLLGDAEETELAIEKVMVGDSCARDLRVIPGSIAVATCRAGNAPRLLSISAGTFGMAVPQPNPAAEGTEVRYTLQEQGLTRLHLVDMFGARVLRLLDGMSEPGSYAMTVETAGLPSGVYLLILESPTRTVTQRVVVEH